MRQTSLKMVHELAKADPRVVFIGSDLSPGLLEEMRREMPERWFMEGIAEQNVVGMAAGMALEGLGPGAVQVHLLVGALVDDLEPVPHDLRERLTLGRLVGLQVHHHERIGVVKHLHHVFLLP